MQTFHFALIIDGCELLSKTASEVSLILISQSQHVEETKEFSHMVPGLLQTTEDTLGSIISVLNAVLSAPTRRKGYRRRCFVRLESREARSGVS